ncbi:MAG: aminotransferase class V-fold PLP-dependent enzyme [Prolixibacteraceae bacterium]|nr:aminotransferase class V-fold PLP-dependent enzyme [Prolixibacteraceae bacterium]
MNKSVYFDNAATTFPKPEEVYIFMDKFYRECGVNVGRGQHKLAFTASNLIAETRILLQDLFHCPNKKVVFTHTATEALNIILQGLPIDDNYNIYLSPFEHNSVTRVISYLQSIYKLNIYTLLLDKTTFTYDLEKIKYQFAENKPNIVVVSHASNVCGVVAPIYDICVLSKPYEAINIIDMSQTAGLIDTDLSSDAFDFAVFAGHKTLYGPLGIAGFTCSGKVKPAPLLYGGTGVDSANQSLPETIPERYEVASPNIMAISGLNAALKWIDKVGIKSILEKEKINHKRLLEVLRNFDNIRIISPTNEDTTIGVVSCVFDGYSSDSIGQILTEHDIAVRTGLHCAPSAHQFLGTFPSGTVRFSVSYFNDDSDFEKLQEVLEYIEDNT